jgi:hypothetical protein
MRFKTFIYLIENIVGYQFFVGMIICFALGKIEYAIACWVGGLSMFLGVLDWLYNTVYGKGKWENKRV